MLCTSTWLRVCNVGTTIPSTCSFFHELVLVLEYLPNFADFLLKHASECQFGIWHIPRLPTCEECGMNKLTHCMLACPLQMTHALCEWYKSHGRYYQVSMHIDHPLRCHSACCEVGPVRCHCVNKQSFNCFSTCGKGHVCISDDHLKSHKYPRAVFGNSHCHFHE